MPRRPQPLLHVEGGDDMHAIIHLMQHHGVDFDAKPRPVEIKDIGSVEKLLDSMETAVKGARHNTIGFVIDADGSVESRWQSIRARLERVDVSAPAAIPANGFIGKCDRLQVGVGVWLMPNNERSGILEDFLRELVDTDDLLIGHAESSTETARQLGARFRDADIPKAVLHCWLAWGASPGLPFGTAFKARYFRADQPIGQRFAAWFQELYQLR